MEQLIKEFCEYGNEWDHTHKSQLTIHGERWETFKIVLNLLAQGYDTPKIIETGCVRQENDYGAGYSTVLFGDFLETLPQGGLLISVDNDQEHIATAADLMKSRHYTDKVHYSFVHAHSVQYLAEYVRSEKINPIDKYFDLIYLDSQDADPANVATTQQAQVHQREEVFYTMHLSPRFILLDDNNVPRAIKTSLSKELLWSSGRYNLVLENRQSLWMKK